MENISVILMLLAFLLFIVGVVLFIIKAIKHQKKKPAILCVLLAIIMLIVSVVIMPTDMGTTDQVADNGAAALTEELETFAAEYCMAYMDSLKNPYSFTVKSAWAHAITSGDNAGKYSVYIKFTAENGLGGTVADEIGAEVISKEDLKNFYPEIHTWGSEPSYKTMGYGQELSAEAVQDYINKNYD